MFHYYLTINGLIKVDKLLELMKESDLKVTKKEIIGFAKKHDFEIENDIIYLNHTVKELNNDICGCHFKSLPNVCKKAKKPGVYLVFAVYFFFLLFFLDLYVSFKIK